jgi:hypothetical protein
LESGLCSVVGGPPRCHFLPLPSVTPLRPFHASRVEPIADEDLLGIIDALTRLVSGWRLR